MDTTDTTTLPAPEAFAHAMAMATHQHTGAVPEDAPAEPVQLRLAIGRPAFDFAGAFKQIELQRAQVRACARELLNKTTHAKHAKQAYDAADGELKVLLDRLETEYQESIAVPEPTQLTLTHGLECSWEREHPGQVCAICAAEREAARMTSAALVDTPDTPTVAALLVCFPAGPDRPARYFSIDPDEAAGWCWVTDVSRADVFETEAEAREEIVRNGIPLDGLVFVPDVTDVADPPYVPPVQENEVV